LLALLVAHLALLLLLAVLTLRAAHAVGAGWPPNQGLGLNLDRCHVHVC
jgi:hypothetical protein